MIKEHASYGMISIRRCTGLGVRFYGTSLLPESFVEISIMKSYADKSLSGKNMNYDGKNIIKVRMTNSQFAELITTLNYGSGIPCTIGYLNGNSIEQPPREKDLITKAVDEFSTEEDDDQMDEQINKLVDIALKKAGKKDIEEIKGLQSYLKNRLRENVKFYKRELIKAGEQVKAQVSTEIEASIVGKINNLGIQTLGQMQAEEKEPLQLPTVKAGFE